MQNKGLLGGLLLLLPQRSNESGGDGDDSDASVTKALAELEQWLVHSTFQVSSGRLNDRAKVSWEHNFYELS